MSILASGRACPIATPSQCIGRPACSLAAFAWRKPQMVRTRLSSPALAFLTMPWKYPPGDVRKCSDGLAETRPTAAAAHSRPMARQASPQSGRQAASGIDDVAPDWLGRCQVGPQPRRQLQQRADGQSHQRAAVGAHRLHLGDGLAACLPPPDPSPCQPAWPIPPSGHDYPLTLWGAWRLRCLFLTFTWLLSVPKINWS